MKVLLICGWLALEFAGASAAMIEETFASDPAARGWRLHGDASLFRWNPVTQALDVTWDSRHSNSFCYLPLHTIILRQDDFQLEFDLFLEDIVIGIDPAKPYTFQIAIGLMRFEHAVSSFRGAGVNAQVGPRNLVEFNYFPDSGFGATVAPTVVSTNNRIVFSDNHPLELETGHWFHVSLTYTASNQVLRTAMTRDGTPFGLPPSQSLADLPLASFAGFRLDTLAVASYSDAGQTPPQFSGSLLAHGTVDNLRLIYPEPPIQDVRGPVGGVNWEVTLSSRTGWLYRLERTTELKSWFNASAELPGNGQTLLLRDNLPAAGQAYYRIHANRP